MSNIRIDVGYTIHDGSEIKFRSPVDCSAITGMVVYYPGADGSTVSKVFTLADAHGNNVGDIDHLFAEDVVVKVILDVTKGMAFVQNADTNAYLEQRFAAITPAQIGAAPAGSVWTATDPNNDGNIVLQYGGIIDGDGGTGGTVPGGGLTAKEVQTMIDAALAAEDELTEEEVQSMIDASLGGIENGTY